MCPGGEWGAARRAGAGEGGPKRKGRPPQQLRAKVRWGLDYRREVLPFQEMHPCNTLESAAVAYFCKMSNGSLARDSYDPTRPNLI